MPLSVFRLGYGAYSDGTLDFEGQCAGSCPLSLRNLREDVDDHTPVLLGFDLMFGPEPVLLGFGFWFTTGTTLESSALAVGERSIGWEFATPFMLGAAVPVNEDVAIRINAFAGPEFLFADDDTAQGRDGDAYRNLCDDLQSAGQISECDVSSPTRFGWTYGFQAGPVFRTSRYNTVGAELALQRIDQRLFSVDAEGASWRGKQTYDYGAWRFWIMVTAGVGK